MPTDAGHGGLPQLRTDYGDNFLLMICSVYGGLKGILMKIAMAGQLPYYKSRGVSSIEYQLMRTVARTPWSLKGLFGTMSDSWPIGGYHKRYWMALSGIWGLLGVVMLSCSEFWIDTGAVPEGGNNTSALESNDTLLPSMIVSADSTMVLGSASFAFLPEISIPLAALCFTGAMSFIAMCDLLMEGKYAEIMTQQGGSRGIVAFVWYAVKVGAFPMALIIGPLSDKTNAQTVLLLGIPFALQALVPIFLGWLPEERAPSCLPDCGKMREHGAVFGLASFQSFSALALAAILLGTNGTEYQKPIQFTYCSLVSVIIIAYAYSVLPRVIANCNLYIFLTQLLYLGMDALDFWYTAPENCVPGGPDFDMSYYLTIVGTIEGIVSIVAVYCFDRFVSKWPVRQMFWITTVVKVLASAIDFIIVKRWNLVVGIPDVFAYILGNATILEFVDMLDFMPAMLLISRLCPKNIEATIFAILAAFMNFGGNLSNVLGALLFDFLGIKLHQRVGEMADVPCNDEQLATAVLFGHILLPLLTIPLTFVLLPSETVVNETASVISMGSQPDIRAGQSLELQHSQLSFGDTARRESRR
eukprot:TRINITY_DN120703_c0_g1_i1.p1 TRINITY_DN120703_c0_g1~~TRINITY_DN120703_c0_g1_i1.p1  ORF type:complete len:585 (+),score=47.20 TRINITY_DN120703_c0_g1_i1:140-1894(+)